MPERQNHSRVERHQENLQRQWSGFTKSKPFEILALAVLATSMLLTGCDESNAEATQKYAEATEIMQLTVDAGFKLPTITYALTVSTGDIALNTPVPDNTIIKKMIDIPVDKEASLEDVQNLAYILFEKIDPSGKLNFDIKRYASLISIESEDLFNSNEFDENRDLGIYNDGHYFPDTGETVLNSRLIKPGERELLVKALLHELIHALLYGEWGDEISLMSGFNRTFDYQSSYYINRWDCFMVNGKWEAKAGNIPLEENGLLKLSYDGNWLTVNSFHFKYFMEVATELISYSLLGLDIGKSPYINVSKLENRELVNKVMEELQSDNDFLIEIIEKGGSKESKGEFFEAIGRVIGEISGEDFSNLSDFEVGLNFYFDVLETIERFRSLSGNSPVLIPIEDLSWHSERDLLDLREPDNRDYIKDFCLSQISK